MALFTSKHRFARISPRKARLVTELIAGRHVNEALDLLKFTNKRASVLVDKVLRAAMADADEKEADVRRLFVHEARVDGGPIIKRFQPKDRGRAHSIHKRTSHIVVTVGEGPRG
ncbi:MAG: 50S ribosomal protein L22 [Phycisphaerae bacterium]|nr:MAG: 50S ribosomal protein L22 [Planctomycetia bacterium]RIK70382.1 MAG: 50S ribosomal protein L22 [Planctomycetota bacterium]GJQ26922.1 MAG: 50S ribosomal protein L22 [Phycisphaerae bacterium]